MAADETQAYAYNLRDELVSGQGNAYAYDLDGNQTLVRTSTGDWTVAYNAENRPVTWTKGDTVVTMVYDRLGRQGPALAK